MNTCDMLPLTAESAMLESISRSMAIAEFAMDGTVLKANDNFLHIIGYRLEELLGQNHRVLCTPEYVLSKAYMEFWNQLRRGGHLAGLYPRQRKDGRIIWLEATYSPIFSCTGEPERIVKLCTDVTERNEANKEEESKKNSILSAMLMAEYTLDGSMVTANENFCRTFGYPNDKLIGKNRNMLYSPEQLDEPTFRQRWDYVTSGRSFTGQEAARAFDGSKIWLESIYTPLRNLSGNIHKIVHFATDVSWRVLQEETEQAELRLLSLVADKSDNAILIADHFDKSLFINESFTNIFGYTREDILGRNGTCVFGPGEREIVSRSREFFDQGLPFRSEEITYSKSGQRFWTSIVATPVFNRQGRRERVVAVLTDITDVKMHQVLQDKALEAMAKDMPLQNVLNLICLEVEQIIPEVIIGIYSINEQGLFEAVAHPRMPVACVRMFEEQKLVPGKNLSALVVSTGEDQVVEDISQSTVWGENNRNFLESGIRACWVSPVKSANGQVMGTIGFYYRNHTAPDDFQRRLASAMTQLCSVAMDRENNRQAMRKLAFYDELTGLPNRNLLESSAEQLLERSRMDRQRLVVMLAEPERFNVIVDSMGNAAANEIVYNIAQRLKRHYGSQNFIARLAEGSFALIFPGLEPGRASDVASRVQSIIGEEQDLGDIRVAPTAAVGISVFPDDGDDVQTLLHNASSALSLARDGGVGKICYFSQEQNGKTRDLLSLESSLRSAIGGREFSLHYQPQVYALNGQLHGAEALARWNNPKLGNVPPDRFIPLIESAGLMLEFSRWVLETSCRQLAEWRSQGLEIPCLSINLSPSVFEQRNLPELIGSYLARYKLTPADFVLELTEGIFLDPDPEVLNTIRRAHSLGYRFSMDDFGTGYSSLSYLRRLPISELKLDKSFVNDVVENETSRKLSRAVISIGKSLDLLVVAEGVETEAQLKLLRDQGYDVIQGYFFAKPLTATDFAAWIKER